MSYTSHKSSGYGCGSVTELTEVPGRYTKCCTRTPRIVARAYRTYRSSGCGYECRTELTEVPGTGMDVVQNSEIPGTARAKKQVNKKRNQCLFCKEPSSCFCGAWGPPYRSTCVCRLLFQLDDVDSQRVHERPLAATSSPVAVRHSKVIDGLDVRRQRPHLPFRVVDKGR